MTPTNSYDRYQRQLILKGFGKPAQDKLFKASVLVIGAGGLGCPLLQYLVAAGVGHIGIADDDLISLSNLHRQVLYTMDDIGKSKVDAAKERLQSMNDAVDIVTWNQRWTQQHCIDNFSRYDIIVDATDNFSSRYLINDACVLMDKPLVFGAVSQYEGQVAVFNYSMEGTNPSVNYRDLFPVPPNNGEVLNCSEAGVLGMLPGIIGAMQATEVIKMLTGIGNILSNKMLTYNVLSNEIYQLNLQKNLSSIDAIPSSVAEFLKMDYEKHCDISQYNIGELDVNEWNTKKDELVLVDIREINEYPKLNGLVHLQIPLSELHHRIHELKDSNLIFVCKSGRRSLQAIMMLKKTAHAGEAFSLKGGVDAMLTHQVIHES